MGDGVVQEEHLLYPILESDFVYQDEKSVEFEDVKCEDIDTAVGAGETEDLSNIPEYVNVWVSMFIDKLGKDHIDLENGVEKAVSKLFMHAIDRGDVIDGPDAEKYVNDIVLKMEFQLMLKGSEGENIVTIADVDQLTRDLFDDAMRKQSLTTEELISGSAGRTAAISNPESDSSYDQEEEYEAVVIEKKNSLLRFKEAILDPEQYENPCISMLDRLIAADIVEEIIDLFDNYLSAENKDSDTLFLTETCINEKLNELLQDDLFDTWNIEDWRNDNNVPEEAYNVLKCTREDIFKLLDETIADARAHYVKEFKNH